DPGKSPTGDDPGKSPTGDDPGKSPTGDDPDLERRRRLQGIEILAYLRRSRGDLPVILMTSEEALAFEDAAEALAVDEFVTLAGEAAFDARALGLLIERVLARGRDRSSLAAPDEWYRWGRSPAMARVRRDALTLARTSLPMLLLGETGTGKSALAERAVHPATGRRGPFIAVDLSAVPPTLAAAELFGTARGAFSGAVNRSGRFEAANGGTLLLDEVANLPLDVQRMLLLTLQDGRITRLGETAPREVDVKLVAATNGDLAAAVAAGTFRADLYARLNPAARLVLPPLRDRIDDLPELVSAFAQKTFAAGADRTLLSKYLDVAGLGGPPDARIALGRAPSEVQSGVTFVLPRSTVDAIRAHAWPGNVRELELFVANASVFALADAVRAAETRRAPAAAAARTIPIPAKLARELLHGSPIRERVTAAGSFSVDLRPQPSLHGVASALERQVYERLYAETGGDFGAMARRLLGDGSAAHARKVQLRFNQIGLKARRRRRGSGASGPP
ncbi:MAG: sigma-54-dependent Fis family transcriptional regulator, partial [Deltaproteobacteria bacterium]|nr:sigma-54-dependent Fis family transcriptional regulator [Deltaproteobacteria bacterium]